MTDTEQVWLVERDYDDKGLVTLVYATPDGQRHVTRERSANMLRSTTVTAADEMNSEKLEPVDDPDLVERYSSEAARMAERHDPDDAV
ncbi:hypothetical protein ACKVMT_11975 [Halobacteriales archaeon Cl-PHB]